MLYLAGDSDGASVEVWDSNLNGYSNQDCQTWFLFRKNLGEILIPGSI